ncbi:M20/M25/M40 family metallo-hydrolase [Chromobacterium sp. Beijing]|uniref:M20/M25/M40 family metallo-hydrolase n=1 Tax=Chromobacterium sp. Beijing TaxID=2735795 RepID=UPI00351CFE2A
MMGSHLDSQPEGGNFDGVYGVLAALEVIRALNDHDVETRRPLEIACWTNEEGARFAPAMLGSSVFAGELPWNRRCAPPTARASRWPPPCRPAAVRAARNARPMPDAYFEAHIEQGRFLSRGGCRSAWSAADKASCGWRRSLKAPAPSRNTPRTYRRDALQAAAAILTQWENDAPSRYPQALWTCGQLTIGKPSRNTVRARFNSAWTCATRSRRLQLMATTSASDPRRRAGARHRRPHRNAMACPPTRSTPAASACWPRPRPAGAIPPRHRQGAGHDAIVLARHCPSAMVFIPAATASVITKPNPSNPSMRPWAPMCCSTRAGSRQRQDNAHENFFPSAATPASTQSYLSRGQMRQAQEVPQRIEPYCPRCVNGNSAPQRRPRHGPSKRCISATT